MADIQKQHHPAAPRGVEPGPPARPLLGPGVSFDRTLEEHREIRRTVQELMDLIGEYRVGMEADLWLRWKGALSAKLFGLRERLIDHFFEEEQSGLYEDLSERLPSLAPRTQSVRNEHRVILEEIGGILATLTVLQSTFPMEPTLLGQTRATLWLIVRHERRESDLIARAQLERMGSFD